MHLPCTAGKTTWPVERRREHGAARWADCRHRRFKDTIPEELVGTLAVSGLASDSGTLDMSQEDKARALVEKAEKKLASWSLIGGGSKYEDAAEMYTNAANLI